MDRESERIGLQEIIDKALEEMAREAGESFELDRINLAEFSRRTGLTRSRARTLKANGFKVLPHGHCGMRAATTVMSGFEGVADALLADGVTNSAVIFERISERGYRGGLTTVKNYIAAHADLVPAKRRLARAEPQGSRGRRFETGPGEAYQMGWGSSRSRTGRAQRSGSRASRWSATTAARATSSSSPTRGRRTCSSA